MSTAVTKVLLLALCGGGLGLGTVHAMDAFGVLIVHTPSIAEGLYRRRPVGNRPFQLGEVVCLDATSQFAPDVLREGIASGRFPALWRDEPLVKHVAALAGSALAYNPQRGVLVDEEALPNSRRKRVDLEGNALPSPSMPTHVPAGHVWLASSHPDGFDSRYIGPVDERALSCVAEAVWTF
jgi:type IV secretory pathway protease TraF